MSTSKAKQIAFSPSTNKAIAKLQNEIFGTLPQLNVKTGYQKMKRMHRGHYIARYYPDPIEKSARLVSSGSLDMRTLCERENPFANAFCFVVRLHLDTSVHKKSAD